MYLPLRCGHSRVFRNSGVMHRNTCRPRLCSGARLSVSPSNLRYLPFNSAAHCRVKHANLTSTPFQFMAHIRILGNIQYTASRHGWMTKLGESLAAYLFATTIPGLRNSPEWGLTRQHAVSQANRILTGHHIDASLPSNPDLDPAVLSGTLITDIIQKIAIRYNPDGMFVVLSIASTLLSFANRCLQESPNSAGPELAIQAARSLILFISTLFPAAGIDAAALFNRLNQRNDDFDSGALLERLQKPIKILFIASDPKDADPLRIQSEFRALQQILMSIEYREAFELSSMLGCRVGDLARGLRKHDPTIIHIAGHGNENGLCLEDGSGKAKRIDSQGLANLLALARSESGNRIEGVVLNACFTGLHAQPVADAVGKVVAMNGSLTDRGANRLTTEFYSALGDGKSLEVAFKWAKAAIELEGRNAQVSPLLLTGSARN